MRPKIIVLESVYSMEADFAPLEDIIQVAQDNGALIYLDEVHAVGLSFAELKLGLRKHGDHLQVHRSRNIRSFEKWKLQGEEGVSAAPVFSGVVSQRLLVPSRPSSCSSSLLEEEDRRKRL